MHEFAYHHKNAIYSVAFNVLWASVIGCLAARGEWPGLNYPTVGTAVVFGLSVYLLHFGFLLNNSLQLGGGKLTLRRQIGKSAEVPLSAIRNFRIAEHRGHAGRRFREMTIRYDSRTLRFNVSDLAEEQAFTRALESRLHGQAKVLDEEEADTPLRFLQRQFERLRS